LSEKNRETKLYLDYKKDDIEKYLKIFKELVNNKNYRICKREKNYSFIEDYFITKIKLREILLSLECEDFCYAEDNDNPDYQNEILFIFGKEYELGYFDKPKLVKIFIKINLEKVQTGLFASVVSFHPEEKPLRYLFKNIK
jgi:hypothetical protein